LKITDVKAYVVNPGLPIDVDGGWQYAFVTIHTDEGLTGWGECSNVPRRGSFITANGINEVREVLIGEDPTNIDRLWHKLFRRYTYLGSRGYTTSVISGVDIALWDLKGKTLNRPIYDLLGGKFYDNVRLYANGWFTDCSTPDEYAAAAKKTVEFGHNSLKLDPFLEMGPRHTDYIDGQISPEGEELGYDIVRAIRDAVGSRVEILIDAHGHYNVPTAVRLANNLFDQSTIGWFEEPFPPEGNDALRQFRQQVHAPVCVGERLFTRYDFMPILREGLADYIMPDVTWTGGITELRKIATMAEAYFIPISPHNAQGPGQILAGSHVSMVTPNFYKLEHATSFIPMNSAFLTEPMDFHDNVLELPDKPGLGHELDLDAVHSRLHPDWEWPGD